MAFVLKAPRYDAGLFCGGGAPGEDAPVRLGLHKLCFCPRLVRALSLCRPSAAEDSVSLDEPSPGFIGPNGTIS